MNTIPISLYIHTPWCARKCPYCDFNSHELRGEALPEAHYIDKLIDDFRSQLSDLQGREIHSIFIGGGTPSLLSPEAYTNLLTALREMANIPENTEITLEANPNSIEQKRFAGYHALGINRLSIGVQSFQDKKLKALGRVHNAKEAIQAIKTAREMGFTNFNVDLMFGLPNQSISDGLFDLQTAIDTGAQHISWYQLTIEPNTYFYKFPPKLPLDDYIWELQQKGQALLAKNNFNQYEVSAYSKAQKPCRHNLNYWKFGDYIGIGAGAHGKITNLKTHKITRRWNLRSPKDYLNAGVDTAGSNTDANTNTGRAFIAGEKVLDPKELPLEFMMNALRLQDPIPLSLFSERTGLQLDVLEKPMIEASEAGFLEVTEQHISLTEQGHRYLNDLLILF